MKFGTRHDNCVWNSLDIGRKYITYKWWNLALCVITVGNSLAIGGKHINCKCWNLTLGMITVCDSLAIGRKYVTSTMQLGFDDSTDMTPTLGSFRLLHSPSTVAIGLSVGYETWPLIVWHCSFVIRWSKYRLGMPGALLHYELSSPEGIPAVFQTPVTVRLHSPNERQANACS